MIITLAFDTIIVSFIDFDKEITIMIKLLYLSPLYLVVSVVIYLMIKNYKTKFD